MFSTDNIKHTNLNTLVFHRILPMADKEFFEDVAIDDFKALLSVAKGCCIDPSSKFLDAGTADTILLTFDDGCATDYQHTLPCLLEADCKAIFFVVPNLVGTSGYCTWSNLREMITHGMTIGSHSLSHPDLTGLSIRKQRDELKKSKSIIEQEIGFEVENFSFPFGRFNTDLIELAQFFGYKRVFTSRHGVANVKARILPRNSIHGAMTAERAMQTIFPNLLLRTGWIIEDTVKSIFVKSMGRDFYLKLRATMYG